MGSIEDAEAFFLATTNFFAGVLRFLGEAFLAEADLRSLATGLAAFFDLRAPPAFFFFLELLFLGMYLHTPALLAPFL
jgi:hypothetical protein